MNRFESARAPLREGAARAPRVLVVDDESDLRELLELTLVGMGLDVDCAADLRSARALLARHRYALCLTDMRLPDGAGIELVEQIVAEAPETPVAVITAFGSADNAVAALKAGAFDYVSKPLGLDALRTLVRSALRVSQTAADIPVEVPSAPAPAAPVVQASGHPVLLGVSPAMEAVRGTIARLARSMAPVAIKGESGSGKELAARLIHGLSSRAHQPFVAVNCGAIPETLMESEFFGHRRGAFTGADQDRLGFFQAAHGGTLFLDEVADLPLAMQVKLLRVIQERRVRRLGAVNEDPVDVRIVSATHQDLARCVAAGRFRQDLFYRLHVIELDMPPLRNRREDIPVLAEAVLARLAARSGLASVPRLASVTLSYLASYSFPGNVRELENMLERALAFSDGETIRVEDLGLRPMVLEASERELAEPVVAGPARAMADAPPEATPEADAPRGARLAPDGVPECLPDYLDAVEREALLRALEATRHNRTAAARRLGISFRALRYRMQRLGIQ